MFLRRTRCTLHLAALEQLILLARGALGAFQTANQKKRHTDRDQEGHEVRVRGYPVCKGTHKLEVKKTRPRLDSATTEAS